MSHCRQLIAGNAALWLLSIAALCHSTPVYSQTADSFNPSANNGVNSLAVQADGKVLLGGFFTAFIGGPFQPYLARFNADGTFDTSFATTADGTVNGLAIQPDGGIVVAGNFGSVDGQPRNRLGRVSSEGWLDPAFNPGADAVVECLALQTDGKILVGGFFGTLGGQPRGGIGRLNADGSIDPSFNPGADWGVTSLIVQPDGKILVGGWFNNLAGTNRAHLGRLNADGSIDTTFNPGASNFVNGLALQADGKILVGGLFTNLAGQACNYLGRLNSNGSIDAGFNSGANDQVFSMAVQTDGAILVGGAFTNLGGLPRNYLGRVATNGVVDASFNPGADNWVISLATQADGNILVGGFFSTLAGTNRSAIGRLVNTTPATQSLTNGISKITWLRGGTGPEIWQATFDASTNGGSSWTNLGATARIGGGWQVTNILVSTNVSIRARGFAAGGQYNGSSWYFVETNIGPLAILQQPLSRTNVVDTQASFTVRAGGASALTYQWRKGGTNLANGPNISGVTSPTLVLSNVFGSDSGSFSVVVSGTLSITSQVATLTVLDPFITSQPASLTNNALTNATFTVYAIGQQPITYQWLKNGYALSDTGNVSGSQSNLLTVTGVLGADAGQYSVVVTDAAGSVTSAVASLSVIDPFIVSQPTNQTASAGDSTFMSVSVASSPPLLYEWMHDGSLIASGSSPTLNLSGLTGADAGFYDVIVSNAFGVVTSAVATLTVNYATADTLNPGLTAYPGSGINVASLAVQADGDIFFGGSFVGPGGSLPDNFGFLNPDGTLGAFAYSILQSAGVGVWRAAGVSVTAIACQTNGAVVIGGTFDDVSGYIRKSLARFGEDGTLDMNFNPGASNAVSCLALQPAGSIIVGGAFTNLSGVAISNICRLLPSGTLDTTFNPGANSSVACLALQPDGKILVGGSFSMLAGQPCQGLGRLNADGSLDTTFNPSPNGAPNAIIVQPDGKIIVGGDFSVLAGANRNYLGRLNPDGSIDTSFFPDVQASFAVNCLALQTDGRIIIGGGWQQSSECFPLNPLARLNSDGTADLSFDPCSTMTSVLALAVQKDGAIVVGGNLTSLDGQPRTAIGRLINDYPSPAAESLTFNSSSVTWLRSGTSTEIWRATFEVSTDGSTWSPLGDASRIPDGWQLTGLTVPTTNSIVRARGFVVGGNWHVETVVGFPVITYQPLAVTNYASSNATFTVTGFGGTPLGYRWLKNGIALSNAGNVSGAQTTTLTLTNILGADAGGYSVVLGNASGSVTSSVAMLTVIDPWPAFNPVSQSRNAGQSASLTFGAVGTAPLACQWSLNGTNLSDTGNDFGSQTGTLTVTNATGANAGTYQAIVTNVWGSCTSAVVSLSVVDPYIYTNPVNQSVKGGQSVAFSAVVAGAQPLVYQWLKNSSPVPAATNPTLVLASAQGFDAGIYALVVSDAFGSTTSAPAALTVTDPYITSNPTNQYLQSGQIAGLTVTAGGGLPVSYQWLVSGSPVQGATNASLIYSNAQGSNAGYYSVIVSDSFGSLTSAVAAVTINAVSNDVFNPGTASFSAMAVQTDGKILLGGGGTTEYPIKPSASLIRLNSEGSPDSTFTAGITNFTTYCLAIQPDGQILVGGGPASGQRALYPYFSRLNSNGSIDSSFTNKLGSGPNGTVYCLAQQADGKLVLGGSFSSVSGQAHQDVARFNSDGSLDTNFNASVSGPVYCIAIQPNGAMVVGGTFNTVDGQGRNYIGRLNSDGSLDTNFNAGANSVIYSMAIQADGRILVGGAFSSLNSQSLNRIARLNSDGTLDATFNPNANNIVYSMIPQTDGRIVVGGRFATMGGLIRNNIARLHLDGSVDLSFNPGTVDNVVNPTVYALAIQPDGAVLAAGQFTTFGGLSRTNLCRLINTDPATQNLTYTSTNVTWLRSGTCPEVWLTTFESSGDGVNWTNLGDGQRISGGWQLAGLSLPAIRNIRAHGFLACGQSDASSAFVESIIGPPIFISQPVNYTNNAGTSVSFPVTADGAGPLSYQWLHGTSLLADGGNVSGSSTSTLTLSNLLGGAAGSYSIIISNSSGVVTGLVANLTVIEPIITIQPANQYANAGDTASFNVAALGSAPINYQWLKNSTNISSANSSTLTLTNVCGADTAAYSVLVSTPYGSALSSNATLRVNVAVPDSFNPGTGDEVRILVAQPDGRILVGYSNTTNGYVSATPLVRLNSDGSPDSAFNPNPSSWLYCVTLQTDGKILVGGTFQTIAGQTQPCIARLNSDGSLDSAFRPAISLFEGSFQPGLYSLAIQPDGRILAGGFFDGLAGGTSSNLCRLNIDGSIDTNFVCSLNNDARTIALQSDGTILIGGDFTTVNGQPFNHIARLDTNGSPDPSFNPGTDNHVYCLVSQPDGHILVAGQFSSLAGVSHSNLGRLNSDGSIDTNFAATANNVVESLALQADGKIMVGGLFSSLAGNTRNSLGRLNPNGSIDTTFFPALSGFTSNVFTPEIQGLALQPDGSLLLGGAFSAVNGQPRASLARLKASDPAGQYLSSDGQTITWLRVGTTPEVWRTTFETSPDGTNWTIAGAGDRILGGWQLAGLVLPANTMLRARGFTGGDFYQGSGWYVECIAQVLAPAPVIAVDSGLGFFTNQFSFNTRALPGQTVVIEATTDFTYWIPVQTNVVTASTAWFNFTDPQANAFPHRFYRARLYVGRLPPPTLGPAGNGSFQSGGFGFNLAAVRGQTAVIDASTNLANWIPIGTNSLDTGLFYFLDSSTTNFPYRFYRARIQ